MCNAMEFVLLLGLGLAVGSPATDLTPIGLKADDKFDPFEPFLANSEPLNVTPVSFKDIDFSNYRQIDTDLGFDTPITAFLHKDDLKFYDATPISDATDPVFGGSPFSENGSPIDAEVLEEINKLKESPSFDTFLEDSYEVPVDAAKIEDVDNAEEILENEESIADIKNENVAIVDEVLEDKIKVTDNKNSPFDAEILDGLSKLDEVSSFGAFLEDSYEVPVDAKVEDVANADEILVDESIAFPKTENVANADEVLHSKFAEESISLVSDNSNAPIDAEILFELNKLDEVPSPDHFLAEEYEVPVDAKIQDIANAEELLEEEPVSFATTESIANAFEVEPEEVTFTKIKNIANAVVLDNVEEPPHKPIFISDQVLDEDKQFFQHAEAVLDEEESEIKPQENFFEVENEFTTYDIPTKIGGGSGGADEIEVENTGDEVSAAAVEQALKIYTNKEYATNCAVVKQRSSAECKGRGSTCWSPGKSDVDCGGDFCCYDGCVNVCHKSAERNADVVSIGKVEIPAFIVPEVSVGPSACVETLITKEEETEVEMCEDVSVDKCFDEQVEECSNEPGCLNGKEIVAKETNKVCKLVNEEQCHPVTREDCTKTSPAKSRKRSKLLYRCGYEDKQVCEPVTKKECHVVVEEKCVEEETEVEEPYTEKVCSTFATNKCTQEPKTECTTVPEEVTKTEHVEQCKDETSVVCHEENVNACKDVKTNVCGPVSKTTAKQVPAKVCHNVPEKSCRVDYVEKCHGKKHNSYDKIVCKSVPQTTCETVTKEKCRTELRLQNVVETVDVCQEKVEQICRHEPKRVCKNTVNNVCEEIPVQKTETVKKEVCRQTTETVCKQVPEKVCHDVTKFKTVRKTENICRQVPTQKCRDVTTQECRTELAEPKIICDDDEAETGAEGEVDCVKVTEDVCRPVPVWRCFDEAVDTDQDSNKDCGCKQETVQKCSQVPEKQCRKEVKVMTYTVPVVNCRK